MASFCRSAARSGMRSMAALRNQNLNSKPFSSPFPLPTSSLPRTSRFAVSLASVESMMPLHSAIANSRLKSSIAVDSSYWSWMSQGYLYLDDDSLFKRINQFIARKITKAAT